MITFTITPADLTDLIEALNIARSAHQQGGPAYRAEIAGIDTDVRLGQLQKAVASLIECAPDGFTVTRHTTITVSDAS